MFNLKKLFDKIKLARLELLPQERITHEESERRRIEVERGKALEESRRALEKELTPEDIEKAQRAAREREETRYGE